MASSLPHPPHILLLPYPAQGHVIPLMEFSYCLLDAGFNVTFVNTDFNHERVLATLTPDQVSNTSHLVSIPDGLGPDEDRNDLGRLCEGIMKTMKGCLEELIRNINGRCSSDHDHDGNRIAWIIADQNMAWAFEVADKLGLQAATFWPAAAATLATILSIPKMIEDGILNDDGLPKRHEMIRLSPGMPQMDTNQFAWNCVNDSKSQQIVYRYMLNNNNATKLARFTISNSYHDLESAVFAHFPDILPVGPLITDQRLGKPFGHFWPEDPACIAWLDSQPAKSVIYVAFGSFTIFNQNQFQQLALGLELLGRPFLWVVRPDLIRGPNSAYPDRFLDRVMGRGKIVDWAPQQKVLAHPSVACFLSHCGWNSTTEAMRNGVPLLCWPYFADQFLNQSYICDVWGVGSRMGADEGGVVSAKQLKAKVDELVGDEGLKERAMMWKEKARMSVEKGGSSYNNLNRFIDALKE